MAIDQVRAQINGTWHTLTWNSSTSRYEKQISAPNVTSYNEPNHYYPVTVEATNTAGTKTTVNDTSPSIGNSLRLRVLEKVKPTISITSPGAGSYVTNNTQPIVFQLRDEVNGSGIDISTLDLKVDGGTSIGQGSPGMVATQVTNGYDCTYTPQTPLSDGAHTVTINVDDYDGNQANQASRTFTVDTVPPTLNVTSPDDGFVSNNATMVVHGMTNDETSSPVTITIRLNGADQGVVNKTNGSFSKTLTLAEGSNTIVVRATDSAGRYTEVTITGTLDTTAPVINSVNITPNPVDAGNTMIISVEVDG